MRVVSGSAKGTKLLSPEGLEARPTLDRVKEAVFSMLGSVTYTRVLDLFSGSGGLGIEALSRGAVFGIFVDRSEASIRVTKENLIKTHLEDKARCFRQDYETFLKNNSEKFDLVFLDPPYKGDMLYKALVLLKDMLLEGARIVCEMDDSLPCEIPEGYVLTKDKKYGRCRVFVLELGD